MKDLSPYSAPAAAVPYRENEPLGSNARRGDIDEAPGLRDYWQVVKKHKWKIAAVFFAAVMITAVIVFSITPIYTARATLLIERQDPQVVNIKQVLSEAGPAEADSYYESQYHILRSRSLAAEVIKTLNLDKNPEFTGEADRGNFVTQLIGLVWTKPISWLKSSVRSFLPKPVSVGSSQISGVDSKLIDIYGDMLKVEPLKGSRLVGVTISSPYPALAASIANAQVEAYVRQGFKLRTQANEEARKFLETKLAELKNRVQESEDGLNQFRRNKGIISLNDKENIVVDRLADLNKRLTEAEAERIGLEAHANLIKKRDYDSLPAVLSHSLIQGLKSQVVQLDAEHAKLSAQFLPGYPRLAQVKAQLDETRSKLAHEIKTVVEGINSAYFAAAGKERELRTQMNKQKADALALKDAAVEYAILAREADTNKHLYDSVLARFKEIHVAGEIPCIQCIDSRPGGNSATSLAAEKKDKSSTRLSVGIDPWTGLGVGFRAPGQHLENTGRGGALPRATDLVSCTGLFHPAESKGTRKAAAG
jgi:uncharacterized protein involved in exopolysaccharide biosynthesis